MKLKYRIIIIVACGLFAIGAILFSALYPRNNHSTIPPIDNIEQDDETENPPAESDDDVPEIEKVYTLMDLGSKGCVPCDNLQPVLASLRTKYEGKINVLFYDIARTSEGAALARKYKVQYMPTLIFLDENGNEVKRIIGFQSQEQLEASFRQLGWL